MKKNILLLGFLIIGYPLIAQKQPAIAVWLTDPGSNIYFSKQASLSFQQNDTGKLTVINTDDSKMFQTIDGFGFALTGGSAMHLMQMQKEARTTLLKKLFATNAENIGTSYLRISMGASDLDEVPFSYDDMPAEEADPELKKFNLGKDKKNLLPVLKEILQINPTIKIMASPWSPPVWMKTTWDTKGGNLILAYYPAYANYFVRYIREMKKQGIRIDAVTIQNEPLHTGNNPSMQFLAEEEAVFVKNHLGPAFQAAEINTKIIVYDHNADKPEYPISILNDVEARKYIDGSAFHLYAGKIDALSKVQEAHPDKNLYFTEQWVGAPGNLKTDIPWHVQNLVIGATRNWCKTVVEWNLSSNPELKPYTERGGCKNCLGAVTIDKNKITYNPAYYVIAHAAKFVRPGSVRIASTLLTDLPNVAFKTPEGKKVMIVLNNSTAIRIFFVGYQQKTASLVLNPQAVATLVW